VYQDAEEIVAIMETSGFGCAAVEVASPEATAGTEGLVSRLRCGWPPPDNPSLPSESLIVYVFDSEINRVRELVEALAFGCGALIPTPDGIPYAYGLNWAVLFGSGEGTSRVMKDVAEALGGADASGSCVDLGNGLDNLVANAGPGEVALEAFAIEDLKGALDEVNFPAVAPEMFPRAEPLPVIYVEDRAVPNAAAVIDDTVVVAGRGGIFHWQPPDAQTWTRVELDPPGPSDTVSVSDVIATPNGFVAVGASGGPVVLTSPSGRDWEFSDLPGVGNLKSVAYGGAGLVAVGSGAGEGPALWTSTDGEHWQQFSPKDPMGTPLEELIETDERDRRLELVLANDTGYVAVNNLTIGQHRSKVWFSNDLTTWIEVDTITKPVTAATVHNDLFVFSVSGEGIWTSSDGQSWTLAADLREVGLGGKPPDWIASGDGLLLAGTRSDRAEVSASIDGLRWTRLGSPTGLESTYIRSVVVYGPGGFYLTAIFRDAESILGWAVWTTRDGTTWTRI
jgi:hypothetical protein